MGLFGIGWDWLGLFGICWDLLGLVGIEGIVWDCWDLYRYLADFLWIIWTLLGFFWDGFGFLGLNRLQECFLDSAVFFWIGCDFLDL